MPSFDIHYLSFDILFLSVSFPIRLAAFQASGGAHMKLHAGVSFSIRSAVFLAGGGADKEDEECA